MAKEVLRRLYGGLWWVIDLLLCLGILTWTSSGSSWLSTEDDTYEGHFIHAGPYLQHLVCA